MVQDSMGISSYFLVDVAGVSVRMRDIDASLGYYSTKACAQSQVSLLSEEDYSHGGQ